MSRRSHTAACWNRLLLYDGGVFRAPALPRPARLHADPAWVRTTLGQFDPGANLYFHFAPAWLTRNTNRPKKIKMGTWVLAVLKLLAALRGVRGSWIDPFKGSLERKHQNLLIDWFETWAELMHNNPSMLHHSKNVVHVLDLFNRVKGFGQVRIESFNEVRFEIQKSVENENKPKLDPYDQNRQQT